MIDIQYYVDDMCGRNPLKPKITRKAARGFAPFYLDLFTEVQKVNPINTLLELGISGAGTHGRWADSSWKRGLHDPEYYSTAQIYGIDILDPDQSDFTKNPSYTNFYKQATQEQSTYPHINLMWKTSAYDPDTPAKAKQQWDLPNGFDVVIDDAATDWPRMIDSLPVWKDHVNLFYLTEVPDGMGVQTYWDMTDEEHMENYNAIAKRGVVVFNLKDFNMIQPGDEKNYNAHHLGVWMPDWSLAKNTIEKYRKYIVAGESNIGKRR